MASWRWGSALALWTDLVQSGNTLSIAVALNSLFTTIYIYTEGSVPLADHGLGRVEEAEKSKWLWTPPVHPTRVYHLETLKQQLTLFWELPLTLLAFPSGEKTNTKKHLTSHTTTTAMCRAHFRACTHHQCKKQSWNTFTTCEKITSTEKLLKVEFITI